MKVSIPAYLLALALAAPVAHAQTITVTAGTDPIDIDPATATIADLPGPDGLVSFSEAMIASNNTPGHQTIGFAIPQSDWQMQWLYPGRAVVWTSYSFYWTGYDSVTIDGTTQTAFTGDTNPNGAEVAFFGGQFYLLADDCVIRGLDSTPLYVNGSRAHIYENSAVGVEIYDGSGSLVERNTGHTLQFRESNDNVAIGNTFDRVRIIGWFANGRQATNNRIGGPAPSDRNYLLGTGTWTEEGSPGGFAVQLFDTDQTVIENNSIGSTPDGMSQGHLATTMGIMIESKNTQVTVRGNRIAGILGQGIGPHHAGQLYGWAIHISGEGNGFDFVGNTVGLNANGEPLLGSIYGFEIGSRYSPSLLNVRIGGENPGEGNTIAGHRFSGVVVGREAQQVRLSGNSIYANQAIGIDLVTSAFGYGVTANDAMDTDAGGNGLQNFPLLTAATTAGGFVHLTGTLGSAASAAYRIDVFASPGCDASGFGEGQIYLGSTSVSTNAAGNAAFDVSLPAEVPVGWVLTSTATRQSTGATSEFSACQVLTAGTTDAAELVEPGLGLVLDPGAPNPFVTGTAIRFRLAESGPVRIEVFDIGGRLVRTLLAGTQPAGAHVIEWDGLDAEGHAVAGGIYLVSLQGGGAAVTRRVVRVR
ncbi:MAG: right-handed parallel beta-helix repeat-containing protein [Candidatus Eisenbacteria bacterium]|nr:right-handed parallel beta-helix repeat-containing protein [Candidatus Eisenbacteria bacterium]